MTQNYWISGADDLLLFARAEFEAIFMLETLMEELACVGLCLNAGKTVVSTNEAQLWM